MKYTVGLFRPPQRCYWFPTCFRICALPSLGFHPQKWPHAYKIITRILTNPLAFQAARKKMKWHMPVDLNSLCFLNPWLSWTKTTVKAHRSGLRYKLALFAQPVCTFFARYIPLPAKSAYFWWKRWELIKNRQAAVTRIKD